MPKSTQNKKALRQKQEKHHPQAKEEREQVLAEIIDVKWTGNSSKNILGCHIDLPRNNQKINTYSIEVVGWVVAEKVKVLAVEIVSDRDRVIEKAPVNRPRPGVAKNYPNIPQAKNSGFVIKTGIIGLPLESELRLQAVLSDQSRIKLGTLKVRRLSLLHSNYQPKLQPLIITSAGESGAELLMELLSGHPSLIVSENPNHQTLANQHLTYLREVLRLSAIGQNYHRSDRPGDRDFPSASSYPGSDNTPNDSELLFWWERTYPEKLAAFSQETIDSFYKQVGKKQGIFNLNRPNKQQLTYFAERYDVTRENFVDLILELYPQGKEIILVRDFRDVTYSMLPFSHRSKNGFDRHKYKGFQEFVCDFGKTQVAHILQRWKLRQQQAYLVKYEDLILSPAKTLKGILEYLQVGNSPMEVEKIWPKEREIKENQQTSKTREELKEELDMWRKDTPLSLRVLCSEVCAEALHEFGYEES